MNINSSIVVANYSTKPTMAADTTEQQEVFEEKPTEVVSSVSIPHSTKPMMRSKAEMLEAVKQATSRQAASRRAKRESAPEDRPQPKNSTVYNGDTKKIHLVKPFKPVVKPTKPVDEALSDEFIAGLPKFNKVNQVKEPTDLHLEKALNIA